MRRAFSLFMLAGSALAAAASAAYARPPGADLLGKDDDPKPAVTTNAKGALIKVEAWDAANGEWRVTVGAGGKASWHSNRPAPLALHARAQRQSFETTLGAAARAKLLAVLRRVCGMRHDKDASAKYRYKFTLQRRGKKRCYVVFDGYDRNRRRQRRRSAVLAELRGLFDKHKPKKMPRFPRHGGL
ncbi:MAG: hypothetical protein KC503_42420 [Myxococcales bacterium]|nr:hypothetical protein [Myxococcales bacterium]